jgi:hypothetical protein
VGFQGQTGENSFWGEMGPERGCHSRRTLHFLILVRSACAVRPGSVDRQWGRSDCLGDETRLVSAFPQHLRVQSGQTACATQLTFAHHPELLLRWTRMACAALMACVDHR